MDEYKYLGTIFSHNVKFTDALDMTLEKARKGASAFWRYMTRFKSMKTSEILRLFHMMVVPILTYNCEIWAAALSKKDSYRLEAFYMKNLKKLLGVGRRTCNAAVHMELGTLPFRYQIQLQLVKFVARMKFNPKKQIHYAIFKKFLSVNCKWVQYWKQTAREAEVDGLFAIEGGRQEYLVWHAQVMLTSLYREGLMAKVQDSSPLRLYKMIKQNHGFEPYLDKINNQETRSMLAIFRCGNTKIRVHTGRIHDEKYEERTCRFCMGQMVEDEIHIFLECECFNSLREKLLQYLQRKFPFFEEMETGQKMRLIMSDSKSLSLMAKSLKLIFSEMEEYLF